ncbi:N-acetyl-beta-glucosaminyl-glycoprotein 4-beta-N-acetylgalactosaminyltransferase 1 [Trichomycterus rosablanca]|uniref:N-acetyl-beta-glucosaminyl-glycoprotein 4-beta-N-acetylgalactosaminyltransferase 1 n=1 Tax=Trichomycterus rosablanca TaxID=2290929 RepID=UPI002F35A779
MRFPLKKIRKQFKLLLLLVLLMFGIGFTYLHVIQGRAGKLHSGYGKDMEKQTEGLDSHQKPAPHSSSTHQDAGDSSDGDEDGTQRGDELGESGQESRGRTEIRKLLGQTFLKLPWKPEYKGRANLHVFEDWCGSTVSQLRRNLHFPLYPHARTTVKKLAVVPKWKNYGLRVFGFIHPYKDGDFQFAISSDDNSELWLSPDENPLNARLLVYVGQRGTEWTAPGEFSKFRSQTSKSVRLMTSRRYYFEILHKQDDRGSDHVEVGWRPFLPDTKYDIIDSAHISLYTDESNLKMNSVKHIPQTLASHALFPPTSHSVNTHNADILSPDPRDTFYKIPMMDGSRLEKVLPPCVYSPTYIVKDFPIARYQGLQFVYLSYVYPNDFTRLTHMERENKCFYRESPAYLEKFGFYKYMKMDEEKDDGPLFFPNPDDFLEEEEGVDPEEDSVHSSHHSVRKTSNTSTSDLLTSSSFSSVSISSDKVKHRDSVRADGYSRRKGRRARRRRVDGEERGRDGGFNKHLPKTEWRRDVASEHDEDPDEPKRPRTRGRRSLLWSFTAQQSSRSHSLYHLANMILKNAARPAETRTNKIHATRRQPVRSRPKPPMEIFPGVFVYQTSRGKKIVDLSSSWKFIKKRAASPFWMNFSSVDHKPTTQRVRINPPPQTDPFSTPASGPTVNSSEIGSTKTSEMDDESRQRQESRRGEGVASEYGYEDEEPRAGWAEGAIDWQRTFSVNPLDFELLRSDWNDLRCNVSGNLQLGEGEATDLVAQYVQRINQHNGGIFTLVRVVNIEKRRDPARGSRYLVEVELMEAGKGVVRLSEYVYLLHRHGRRDELVGSKESASTAAPPAPSKSPTASSAAQSRASTAWRGRWPKPLLCRPAVLQWRNDVTVHIVVPVKNQARWVQQFISDMELLHRETGDENFNIIMVDFESDDMDVERALRDSTVPRYEYLRREGNFERSSGLQMGVNTITESHSIVFLCDLHIHFPPSILESVRKHCVEGKLAFAPIVMRLDCGSSPFEPNGYWEVNGFGLFGIYKSDFDKIGGMNTEEFKDRWGGEDWEFLDRVLQNGLEVERLRLRNFYHYYHSKRGMWNTPLNKARQG